MKKIKVFIVLISLGILFFVYHNYFNQKSSFPEPSFIPFEKQEVVSFFDWSLIGPSGKEKNMFIDKGNVMVVHFWDVNNPNSIAELKEFQNLYNDYKSKVQFYFVTKNSQVEVRKFIEKHNFSFPVFFSLSIPPKGIENKVVPSTYLINKKGRIIVYSKVSANWDSEIFRKVIQGLL